MMTQANPGVPRILMSFSPTYMPYFDVDHYPSNSSSNTRQRGDYEDDCSAAEASNSRVVSHALVDDEDEEEEAYGKPPQILNCSVDGYPACELPFASEPALETELEQGLPPLKKLKSAAEFGQRDADFRPPGLVVLGTIKGILTRRDGGSSGWTSPAEVGSPKAASSPLGDKCFSRWPLRLEAPTLAAVSSRPLSRRSSSGASSSGTASLKAVRFASGSGYLSCWDRSDPSTSGTEGLVAAEMYLTHSAEAYDRSPIVVEQGLRLPPRAKKEEDEDGDAGEGIEKEEDEKRALKKDKTKCGRDSLHRPAKHSDELQKSDKDQARPLCSPRSLFRCSQDSDRSPTTSPGRRLVCSPLLGSIEVTKWYREVVVEEDEEEEAESCEQRQDDDDDEEEDEEDLDRQRGSGIGSDDEDEEDSDRRQKRGDGFVGGFGNWSTDSSFDCCDALGGF